MQVLVVVLNLSLSLSLVELAPTLAKVGAHHPEAARLLQHLGQKEYFASADNCIHGSRGKRGTFIRAYVSGQKLNACSVGNLRQAARATCSGNVFNSFYTI